MVLRRPAATEPGLLIYIMVDSVAQTVDAVIANGGEMHNRSCRRTRNYCEVVILPAT